MGKDSIVTFFILEPTTQHSVRFVGVIVRCEVEVHLGQDQGCLIFQNVGNPSLSASQIVRKLSRMLWIHKASQVRIISAIRAP